MNPHRTCSTCLHNHGNRCTCEASRYRGHAVKAWNTCSQQKEPPLIPAELVKRLAVCAAGLEWRAERALDEYYDFYADRAAQCRKWIDDLKAGLPVDADGIEGGLREFEAIAL